MSLLCLYKHKPRRMQNGWDKLGSGICCDRCTKMLARERWWLTMYMPDRDVVRFIPNGFKKGKIKEKTYGPKHPRKGYK